MACLPAFLATPCITHLPTAAAASPTASLALPVHLSKRERLQRVHDVLAVLGLSKASGTMVREGRRGRCIKSEEGTGRKA